MEEFIIKNYIYINMINKNELINFYLDYIQEDSLKKVFQQIISFFEKSDSFKAIPKVKDNFPLKDIQIYCTNKELDRLWGRINHPFSMVIYKEYFSFYVRGKNNVFRNDAICQRFPNCHKNPAGEPIIKIKTQKDVDELFDYIFHASLNINKSKELVIGQNKQNVSNFQKSNENMIRILEDYLVNFYGYGNPDGDYWFIGLEEGDLTRGKELEMRLKNWENEHDEHFMDVAESHKNLAGRKFYVEENNRLVKNQATITKAVKMYLILSGNYNKEYALNNKDIFHKEALKYQGRYFARKDYGETAILELYPLPCHKTNSWEYGNRFNEIPWLSNKRIYMDYMNNVRVPKIFELIKSKKPKFVVLYSKRKDTEKFIPKLYSTTFDTNLKLKKIGNQEVMYNNPNGTTFFFIPHISPQAGMSNKDLFSIAEEMINLKNIF